VTAIHEAAHAVVAVVIGLSLNSVTREIEEWGMAGSIGLSVPGDYTATTYPALARKQIVAAFAGPIAELRASGDLEIAADLGDMEEPSRARARRPLGTH
jgi:hypothetical protein